MDVMLPYLEVKDFKPYGNDLRNVKFQLQKWPIIKNVALQAMSYNEYKIALPIKTTILSVNM